MVDTFLDPSVHSLDDESSNPAKIQNCPKKRIVVACDGTWMDSDGVDQVPSNITRIARAVSAFQPNYKTMLSRESNANSVPPQHERNRMSNVCRFLLSA